MSILFDTQGVVLYLAWNFNIKFSDMLKLRRSRKLSSLPAIFTPESFPLEFLSSKLIGCVQFGIPLKPGIPLFASVDVFVLTLDCLLQVGSGTSVLSDLFEPFEIVVAYIDEAHNIRLHSVYCAALLVSTLFVLGDEEQFAETYAYGSQRGRGIVEDHKLAFHWEKALSGPTFMSPWCAMRLEDIFVETRTLLFGVGFCGFLQLTVEGYGPSALAISSQ